MKKTQPSDLLPEVTRNKAYEKKQKFAEKKRLKELRRENPQAAAKLEKAKLKAAKKAKIAKALPTAGAAKKNGKSSKSSSTAGAAGSAAKVAKKKVKERRPKTVVANAPTGRETLVKAKARELVKEKRSAMKKQAQLRADAVPKTRTNSRRAVGEAVAKDEEEHNGGADTHGPDTQNPADLEQLLLERTIRGGGGASYLSGRGARGSDAPDIRHDPSLYPSDVAFYDDYAEKKQTEAVSEDALLKRAHDYFKSVGKRERQLNVAAATYLRKMKEVNRQGGDKDGFRYVLPKNVKDVVKMMKEKENYERKLLSGTSGSNDETWVDGDELRTTFGGDDEKDMSDKPMRRRKKRNKFSNDFYQFQVTKRWTKNAESFLNRGRAHKSLFEAKKRQRSIRKL